MVILDDEGIKRESALMCIISVGDNANKIINEIISDGKKIDSVNFINYMNYITVSNNNVTSNEELSNMIYRVITPYSIVIIATEIGDDTGSNLAPVIASIVKSKYPETDGIVGIAVKPSVLDNTQIIQNAEHEINNFQKSVDLFIAVDNTKGDLFKRAILTLPKGFLSREVLMDFDWRDLRYFMSKDKTFHIITSNPFCHDYDSSKHTDMTDPIRNIAEIFASLPLEKIKTVVCFFECGTNIGSGPCSDLIDDIVDFLGNDINILANVTVDEFMTPDEMCVTFLAAEKSDSDYDKVIHSQFEDTAVIDYGIIKGNETIVFIKAGQYGTIYGYKNKYLKMAKAINEKYGYTVICSSNPFNGKNPLDNAMKLIDDYCKENKLKDYTIYYMGHSNGALIGAWYGINYPRIKRMLLVNGPIQHNWHKTKNNIKKFSGEKMVFVYGSLDPSYQYTELIHLLSNDKVKLEIIEGEDHNFSKGIFDFKTLTEDFLLN